MAGNNGNQDWYIEKANDEARQYRKDKQEAKRKRDEVERKRREQQNDYDEDNYLDMD